MHFFHTRLLRDFNKVRVRVIYILSTHSCAQTFRTSDVIQILCQLLYYKKMTQTTEANYDLIYAVLFIVVSISFCPEYNVYNRTELIWNCFISLSYYSDTYKLINCRHFDILMNRSVLCWMSNQLNDRSRWRYSAHFSCFIAIDCYFHSTWKEFLVEESCSQWTPNSTRKATYSMDRDTRNASARSPNLTSVSYELNFWPFCTRDGHLPPHVHDVRLG